MDCAARQEILLARMSVSESVSRCPPAAGMTPRLVTLMRLWRSFQAI